MFTFTTTTRMHHTDSAGVLFFANLFSLAHDCYEEFLNPSLTIRRVIEEKSFVLPIIHAQADYLHPIKVSEQITIQMICSGQSDNSFTLIYNIVLENGKTAAKVTTVHTAVDKQTQKSTALPAELKELLAPIC